MKARVEGLLGRFRRAQRPLVRFQRRGGTPPPDWESLEVSSDGRFTLWRTVNRRRPGARVGRFTGCLSSAQLELLREALKGAPDSGPVGSPPAADSAMETIHADGRRATMPADANLPEGWERAAGMLRGMIDGPTGDPLAAIGLEVSRTTARLVHTGAEPLELDLSRASVGVARMEGDAVAGQWQSAVAGPRSVTAGPGWSMELPFTHGLADQGTLVVDVDHFLAFDGDFWRPCGLSAGEDDVPASSAGTPAPPA